MWNAMKARKSKEESWMQIAERSHAARHALVALFLLASATGAQEVDAGQRDTVLDPRSLPREISHEVIDLFNAPGTLRSSGRLDIAPGREVRGDVAVLNGPLTIGGRVTGRVVAINTDVTFLPGARLDSDLTVVGGAVRGAADASIGGEIRVYRQPLRYRHRGDRIVADRSEDDDDERWWRHVRRDGGTYSALRLTSAHTYNRVEGFPIYFGPRIRRDLPGGARLAVDAFGIFRTADRFEWDSENLGHLATAEIRSGGREGIALGARVFDVVEPVESWQLNEVEVGLASFFLTRDYRDYYGRHGGEIYARLFAGRQTTLTFGLSDERWGDRRDKDPFTLFRSSAAWRPNPAMDEGHMHRATARLGYDTRNNRDDPRSGWLINAEYERGRGGLDRLAAMSDPLRPASDPDVEYGRAFFDARRYNRVAPDAQLNMRVVLGGWTDGDPLPLQRRLSLSGPGALAGYSFRSMPPGADVLHCSSGVRAVGIPAECERMVLTQLEYRGDLEVNWNFSEWNNGSHYLGSWVVFVDAGRGWLVGPEAPGGTMTYSRGTIPPLSTWRTDVGLGMDFDAVGVYVAKAVGGADKLPPNFFIRLTKRF
jgi:hypothetical protein